MLRSIKHIQQLGTFTWLCISIPTQAKVRQRTANQDKKAYILNQKRSVFFKRLNELFNVHLHQEGLQTGLTQPHLIISNHRSVLDISALVSSYGSVTVSRDDVQHWPLLGWTASVGDTIYANRENPFQSIHVIRQIKNRLTQGQSVIVFPEGGAFSENEVQPFRPTMFASLRRLEVPILPVGFAYERHLDFGNQGFTKHIKHLASQSQIDVFMQVGQPYVPQGTVREIAQDAHYRVQALVDLANRRFHLRCSTPINDNAMSKGDP